MSYNKYTCYVLCEDRDHFNFISGYLKKKGVTREKIKLAKDYPEGRGDAKNFVRLNYTEEARKIRQKPKNVLLIVLLDADEEDFENIVGSFDDKDNVFVASPKRNIETWFYYFHNKGKADCVDESVDRKGGRREKALYKPSTCGELFVDIIDNIRNGQTPLHLPPSLNATAQRIIELEKKYHR